MEKSCFFCGQKGSILYGYVICDLCKSHLKLFTDKKIEQYILEKNNYKKEIQDRLEIVSKAHAKAKIKLLHIQNRIEQLNNNK